MWICPVCNRKNEENLLCCPACSFDASSNYENFNTLNSLAEGTAAISRRKESAIESTIKSSNGIDWPNVTAIAQCLWHTVVLYRDGRTAAFGDNDMDQCEVSEWNHITAIAAGGSPTGTAFTLGLHADGTVVAAGRLGINRKRISRCVSEWTNIIAIAAGGNHMVGLRSDGTVIAAGDNIHGQCEVSDWEDITAIACGHWHTVGLKSDGTVVSAGDNIHGQCGISNLDHPELFDEDDDDFYWKDDEEFEDEDSNEEDSEEDEDDFDEKFIFPEEWNDITAIACGMWHTVGLKADGTVVAIGDNAKGACNTRGWSRIRRIACGDHTTLGLDVDGNILTAGKPRCDGQFVLTEKEKDFLPYADIRKI